MKYILAMILLKLLKLATPADPASVYHACTREVRLSDAGGSPTERQRSDAWYATHGACARQREDQVSYIQRGSRL